MDLIFKTFPYPAFIKRKNGEYILVNQFQLDMMGLKEEQVVGKKDDDFVTSADQLKQIHLSDRRAIETLGSVDLPNQAYTSPSGNTYYFKTSKVGICFEDTDEKFIFGVSIDISHEYALDQLILHKNMVIDIAGRQRMYCQKIGFLCLQIHNGSTKKITELKRIIDLFDHSQFIIRYGGSPRDVVYKESIKSARKEHDQVLKKVEECWNLYKEAALQLIEAIKLSHTEMEQESIIYIEDNSDDLLYWCNQMVVEFSKEKNKLLK